MDEEADVGVLEEVDGLFGRGVRGHDDEGAGGEARVGGLVRGGSGEVGVVH